ncbi:uncharacterized protein J3R85_018061 [Psidium guajava]|nr:uncharacterized protein J3R85_018061 [Psidium guajava]
MAAEDVLRSREVSAMIKQGFIPSQALSLSPSRATAGASSLARGAFYSPSSSPSKTLSSPSPPHCSSSESAQQVLTRPTLFDMMSQEQHRLESSNALKSRLSKILSNAPFINNIVADSVDCNRDLRFGSSDVRLTVVSRDGFRVSMDVHRRVLSEKSRYFEEKLRRDRGISHSVDIEISECDDLEVYVETVVLMYSEDLKQRLIGEGVDKVLGLLKVSSAIMFDIGITACLEYLEAVPWSNNEEEKVISHLRQLQLHDSAAEVLHRVSAEPSTSSRADDVFLRLLSGVLQAKDDKARREMKSLISRLLREDASDCSSSLDVSRDSLYHLCHRCLSSLILCLSEAAGPDENRRDRGTVMAEIAREADNMHWIVEILIDKNMGDEFVKLWADQKELAILHSKIPTFYRHEISRITAQLCVAMGKGLILVPKDARLSLLSTWLEALYEDFGWMRRASRLMDKKLLEDGLGQTILTLPLPQQQAIFLSWFDRYLNKGDDCPDIQKAFEIWWRRAFIRQHGPELNNSHLQIAVCGYPN